VLIGAITAPIFQQAKVITINWLHGSEIIAILSPPATPSALSLSAVFCISCSIS
jgi:hypothetical protein